MAKKKNDKLKTLTLNEFIEKAKQIHRDKYNYSKVEYVNNHTKVCIICPEHGEFWQTPSSHLGGSGCKKCFDLKKKTLHNFTNEQFISKAKLAHGDKYDYSKVEYVNARTKVCIVCPEHGEFWQIADAHMRGNGCPKCGIIENNGNSLNTKDFIEKSKLVHGDKYDYSKSVYDKARNKILITCPKHGEFWQIADAHMRGSGCPKCGNVLSNAENEIYDFIIKNTNYKVTQRRRDIIPPYEIDIFIEDLKIGIEYHGIYWHSDKFKKNNSHYDKLILCKNNGIKLIQIFEDEWNDNKEIVLSKISHLLNIPNITDKIMARKTKIQVIDKNTAQFFLNKNHIQGYANATVNFGCFYNDTLIGVMSFKKINDKLWELTRFASDYNYICCGIGGKLFKHFIREYKPELVKSFADRRWTIDEENNIYCQLGFKFDGYTRPDYKYLKSNTIQRIHKFNFRKKSLLRKYPNILNENMTENEMTKKLGYYKIYDCGLIRYVWKNNL